MMAAINRFILKAGGVESRPCSTKSREERTLEPEIGSRVPTRMFHLEAEVKDSVAQGHQSAGLDGSSLSSSPPASLGSPHCWLFRGFKVKIRWDLRSPRVSEFDGDTEAS